jgi:hypothetical protein
VLEPPWLWYRLACSIKLPCVGNPWYIEFYHSISEKWSFRQGWQSPRVVVLISYHLMSLCLIPVDVLFPRENKIINVLATTSTPDPLKSRRDKLMYMRKSRRYVLWAITAVKWSCLNLWRSDKCICLIWISLFYCTCGCVKSFFVAKCLMCEKDVRTQLTTLTRPERPKVIRWVFLIKGLVVFIMAVGPSICCPRVLKFLIASMKATGFNQSLWHLYLFLSLKISSEL